ncbi:hypothetical protein VNO78_20868 [Psophocarpus tetragonolobus]|uniref:Uncharacterized protein n=1 Tax=Psophocarpus tetragonolobus TaxID=3891 RepID=A0AAN9SBQ4_PSOTE
MENGERRIWIRCTGVALSLPRKGAVRRRGLLVVMPLPECPIDLLYPPCVCPSALCPLPSAHPQHIGPHFTLCPATSPYPISSFPLINGKHFYALQNIKSFNLYFT